MMATVSAEASEAGDTSSWLVVVHQNSELTTLSQKQVMSLFLGRAQFLPSGSRVKIFDFPVDSINRAQFYLALTGKHISDIDAYWARLRYSGRASPPQSLNNAQDIIKQLSAQQGGLAYLPSKFESMLAANGLKAVLSMRSL
jgi:hypothetical protein